MIGFYDVVLCSYEERFCFSLKVSFSYRRPDFLVKVVAYLLFKTPIDFFLFPFLFPNYCHSVRHHVVSIVSDSCNHSAFVHFYSILKSLYRCVNAVFNDGKFLPPSFLDTYILSTLSLGCNAFCIVIGFLVLWYIFFSSSLVNYKTCPEYLTRNTAQVFIILIRFPLDSLVSSCFLVLLRYSVKFISGMICLTHGY